MTGNNTIEEIRLPPKGFACKDIPHIQGATGRDRKAYIHQLALDIGFCLRKIDIGQGIFIPGKMTEERKGSVRDFTPGEFSFFRFRVRGKNGTAADQERRTEAAVMREILTERGVPEDRLILEDQAKTTKENFSNIAGIVSAGEPVVMISSNYHMDRAVRNATENGFTHVMRLPAPSGFLAYGANMLSEVVLDLNDLTK